MEKMDGDASSICNESVLSSARSGSRCSFGPLQSMAARDELRRRRREELKARYENAKKQKEMELKAKLERESQLEKLQRKAYIEQKKLEAKEKLEKEKERNRQRELRLQQLELASLHCFRRKLNYYGMGPWKKLVQNRRMKLEQAWLHFSRVIGRKIFASWWKIVLEKQGEIAEIVGSFRHRWCQIMCLRLWEKTSKTNKLYTLNLMKRSLYGFREAIEDTRFAEKASITCTQMRLYKWMWSNWKLAVINLKNELLFKQQVASRHVQRASCARSFKAWTYAISDELSEKEKLKSRAEMWAKINNWLEEYHQGKKHVEQLSCC